MRIIIIIITIIIIIIELAACFLSNSLCDGRCYTRVHASKDAKDARWVKVVASRCRGGSKEERYQL